jgi:mannose-1-phosphate guanylyltransferase/phosphomannomutase
VAATSEIEELARQYGVEVTFTKNTHASMMEAASEESTSFVGGTLGGFIFPEYFFAVDGMFTAAKILEMLAVLGRNLSELASELPKRVQQRRQVYCPTEQIGTVMRHAMDHSNEMRRVLVDGIKMYPISTSDAWVLVLPEKEKPYCDVTVDAADSPTAERLGEEYARYVFEWRGAQ